MSNTLQHGGAERQRVTLANALVQRGHQVSVVVLQSLGALADELLPQVDLRGGERRGLSKVDAVVTGITNTEAAYAMRWKARHPFRRSPWLAASHSWSADGTPLYSLALGSCVRLGSAAVVALSEGHRLSLCASDRLCGNVHVIPNGTDLPAVAGPRPPRESTRPLTLGFVGRIEYVKGLDRLLHALSKVDPAGWVLVVHGDGSQRPILVEYARTRGLPVEWAGPCNDVAGALDRIDLLIVPSRSEAAPMVVVEAAARRVPVLAAAVGAVPEMLRQEASGEMLPEDEIDWPRQLSRIIKGGGVRRPAWAEPFRWSSAAMVDEYERLLASVLSASSPRRSVAGR